MQENKKANSNRTSIHCGKSPCLLQPNRMPGGGPVKKNHVLFKEALVHILTLDAPCTLCTTDYRHMLAKSIILFGPNSNPSPK